MMYVTVFLQEETFKKVSSHLQLLLSDQKGVYNPSAHVTVHCLFYFTKQSQVLFPVSSTQSPDFISIPGEPFPNTRKYIVQLETR